MFTSHKREQYKSSRHCSTSPASNTSVWHSADLFWETTSDSESTSGSSLTIHPLSAITQMVLLGLCSNSFWFLSRSSPSYSILQPSYICCSCLRKQKCKPKTNKQKKNTNNKKNLVGKNLVLPWCKKTRYCVSQTFSFYSLLCHQNCSTFKRYLCIIHCNGLELPAWATSNRKHIIVMLKGSELIFISHAGQQFLLASANMDVMFQICG